MRRNIEKEIKEGMKICDKNPKGDITVLEFKMLESSDPNRMEAVHNAYLVGVALGYRMAKREAKKKAARA